MHQRVLGLVVACAGLVAATPAVVHAECAPEQYFGTPSGTTLPSHGSIYLFDKMYGRIGTRRGELAVHFVGRPGVYEVVQAGDGLARIDYLSFDGALLDVTIGGDAAHAIYQLDADWRPESAPRVLQYWHAITDRYAPDEIASGSVEIQIDQPVAAVEARWQYAGQTTEWRMTPHTLEDFINASVLEVGDVPCGAGNVDIREIIAGGHLELTAIRFDGSRAPIRGLPARLVEAEMPRTQEGVSYALKQGLGPPRMRLVAHRTPSEIAQEIPADWNPFLGLDDAMGAALLGGGVLAIGCFVFLKLRRRLVV